MSSKKQLRPNEGPGRPCASPPAISREDLEPMVLEVFGALSHRAIPPWFGACSAARALQEKSGYKGRQACKTQCI